VNGEPVLIDTRTAAEMTGLKPGSIRAAVRRGDLDLAALGPRGPYGRATWLISAEQVVAWRRARGDSSKPAATSTPYGGASSGGPEPRARRALGAALRHGALEAAQPPGAGCGGRAVLDRRLRAPGG
jgi:hypothetical protein